MSSVESSIARSLLRKLPSPLALPAQRYVNARGGAVRAAHLLEATEAALRFAALVATADALGRSGAATELRDPLAQALRDPSAPRWWDLLQAATLDGGEPFVPELVEVVHGEAGADVRTAVDTLVALWRDPGTDRHTLLAALDTVLNPQVDGALAALLSGLSFLARYTLVLPVAVLSGHQRDTVLAQRHHGPWATGHALTLEVARGTRVEERVPLLFHPHRNAALPLAPFLGAAADAPRLTLLAQTDDEGALLLADSEGRTLGTASEAGEVLTLDSALLLGSTVVLLPDVAPESAPRLQSDCGTIPTTPETPEIYRTAQLLRLDDASEVLLAGDEDAWSQLWLRAIHPSVAADAEHIRALAARAEALLEPSSDRLLAVGDFGFASGIGRFVTSVMAEPGITLAERLAAEGSLPVGEAATVARDVVDALLALEAAGVPPQPVRAAQVLVDASGRARLSIFPLGDDLPGEELAAGAAHALADLMARMTDEAAAAPVRAQADAGLAAVRAALAAVAADPEQVDPSFGLAEARLAWLQSLCNRAQRERAQTAERSLSTQDHETAVLSLEELAESAWDPAIRREALLRAARIYAEQLEDLAAARTAYEAVLANDGAHAEAASFLERDAEQRQDWQRLSELLLDRFATAETDDAKAPVLRRLVTLFENELGDVDAAFFVLRKLLDVDRGEHRFDEIERLAQATDRWDDLVQAYDELAESEEPAAAAELRVKAARLLAERLGRPDEARARLQVALDAVPDHDQALVALSSVLAQEGKALESSRLLARRAALLEGEAKASALAQAATAAEDGLAWGEAILLHQARAALLGGEAAAAVWKHVGDVQRMHLRALELARASYEHALTIAPAYGEALEGLETLAHEAGDKALLRDLLKRQVAAAGEDPEGRLLALRRLIDRSAEADLSPEALSAAHRTVLELAPDDAKSLAALLDLARQTERWEEVVALTERRAATLSADETAALRLDAATILHEKLGDPTGAARILEQLYDQKPDDIAVQDALIAAYRDSRQLRKLVSVLENRGVVEEDDGKRGALLTEAARLAVSELSDESRAIALYETVLELQPGHTTAARELARIYRSRGEVERALPLAQVSADSSDADAHPDEAAASFIEVAHIAEELMRFDVAREAYAEAARILPSSAEARMGAARSAEAAGDSEGAVADYRALLDDTTLTLTPDERAAAERALGELTMRTGSAEESRALLDRAHAQNPNDEKVLRDLVQACDRTEDWPAAIRHRTALARVLPDRMERAALLMQAGDIAHDKLKDVRAAIDSYKAAQVQMPSSKATAARLLRLHLEAQDFEEAIETLRRLIDLEEDKKKKASHRLTLALIYRDHLRDDRRAVAYLNETLDDDPLRLEAFEALDGILVRRKAWEEQADSYESMLERISELPGQEALAFRLLRNQAEVLASISQTDRAVFALEKARALRPQDPETRLALARLLETDDSTIGEAVAEYRAVLYLDGSRAEAYRALRRLFTRSKQADAAWCACGVLSLINEADEKERAYYEAHRVGALKVTQTIKTEDTWPQKLYADLQDPQIGALLLGVYKAVPERFETDRLESFGLTERNRIDLRVRTTFNSFAGTIPRILGVAKPVYYLSTQVQGIRKLSFPQPAFLVGMDVHDGMKGKRLRFTLGKALAYLHPRHVVATMQPTAVLQAALEAVYLLLSGNELQVERATANVQEWYAALRNVMTESDKDALRPHAEVLFRTGVRPDVASWQVQVEMSANHAGLLLCNDIEVAVECMEADPAPPTKAPVREKVKDLVRYALAPRYHELRSTLGIAITDEPAPTPQSVSGVAG